ncbi:transglycosylase SLT domain-containing protein [Kiloniella sp. GXU_MW_B19]|uniref:transglycosylase SLT domain-containing protein n=1 Tax=Kiloniella sp. GXU_MW_B19 TaxID=3141326 RepID=UPI003FA0D78E
MTKRVSAKLGLIASALPVVTSTQCFEAAGARYQVRPDLLRSIAFVESSWNNKAINQNSNGSEDVCMMQFKSF